MKTIFAINEYFKKILDPKTMQDVALNGIQVENDGEIKRVAFAVDLSLSSIEKAIKERCDLIFVHHGFFWGKSIPITHSHRKRLKLLLQNNIGVIAYHLPLDCHPEYGNNAQILKKIGITEINPFGSYKGFPIGFEGTLERKADIEEICNRLGVLLTASGVRYLSFNSNKEIRKISVVSGGGGSCFNEAIEKGIDLFITGDSEHELYHQALDNSTNILFAGHYFTETFGVKAIKKKIEEDFGIFTIFCDIPTGL